jgi:hypothetical protein
LVVVQKKNLIFFATTSHKSGKKGFIFSKNRVESDLSYSYATIRTD